MCSIYSTSRRTCVCVCERAPYIYIFIHTLLIILSFCLVSFSFFSFLHSISHFVRVAVVPSSRVWCVPVLFNRCTYKHTLYTLTFNHPQHPRSACWGFLSWPQTSRRRRRKTAERHCRCFCPSFHRTTVPVPARDRPRQVN